MCAGGKLGWLDVCWRECLGKLRGATLQRTPKTGKWAGIPGSAHFSNAAALQHTLATRQHTFLSLQHTSRYTSKPDVARPATIRDLYGSNWDLYGPNYWIYPVDNVDK